MKHREAQGIHPRRMGAGGAGTGNARIAPLCGPAERRNGPSGLWDTWSDCRLWPDCVDVDGAAAAGTRRDVP